MRQAIGFINNTGWLGRVQRRDSPFFDARPPGSAVDLLVMHYISLPAGVFNGDAIERLFMGTLPATAHASFAALQGLQVSAHFVIRRTGLLLQFVDCDQRAWHAGVSSFLGRERCNDFSIGIEMEGDAHHFFTQAQYRCLYRLIPRLRSRYPLRFITGHENIAPGRKDDPGPRFDWRAVLDNAATAGLSKPI
jgi:N-acetyl-anhydromuramoyl-L-alanine amidase